MSKIPPAAQSTKVPAPPRILHPWAGVLSYLVPGLGQIVQGRVAKGVLFLVCIYTLFFYGLYHGSGSVTVYDDKGQGEEYTVSGNVYLPNVAPDRSPFSVSALANSVYNRLQYLGQFWVGVAAWPALWQYNRYTRDVKDHEDELRQRLSRLRGELRNLEGEKAEQKQQEIAKIQEELRRGDPLLGQFERAPDEKAINAVENGGDKRLGLAWVYTVIAGVLNIMVIYDAVAGPAFVLATQEGQAKAKAVA
jgi:hypothetical protein